MEVYSPVFIPIIMNLFHNWFDLPTDDYKQKMGKNDIQIPRNSEGSDFQPHCNETQRIPKVYDQQND